MGLPISIIDNEPRYMLIGYYDWRNSDIDLSEDDRVEDLAIEGIYGGLKDIKVAITRIKNGYWDSGARGRFTILEIDMLNNKLVDITDQLDIDVSWVKE